MGRLTGKGKAILTSNRLLLVNNPGSALKVFDIPLPLVFHEKFILPIFNANYI